LSIKGHPYLDIKDQKFGKLTAIEYQAGGRWIVECEVCGNRKSVLTHNLRTGNGTCGKCDRWETGQLSRVKDLTEKKFGKLTPLRYIPGSQGQWVVRCDCGTELSVNSRNLKRGFTKSCGCIKHSPRATRQYVEPPNSEETQ
jgi:hypothetical protein